MEGNGKDSGEACVVDGGLGVVVGGGGRDDPKEQTRNGIWQTNGTSLSGAGGGAAGGGEEDVKLNVHKLEAGLEITAGGGGGGGGSVDDGGCVVAAAAVVSAVAPPCPSTTSIGGGSRGGGDGVGVATAAVGDDGGSCDDGDDDEEEDDEEEDDDGDEDEEEDEGHYGTKSGAVSFAASSAATTGKANVPSVSAKGKEKMDDDGSVKARLRKRKERASDGDGDGDGDEAEEISQQQIRILPASWTIPSQPPSLTWTATAVNGSPPEHLTLVQGAPGIPQKLSTAIVPLPNVTPTAGNGTEHSRRRRYTPRATPLTNEAVMELIKAKREDVKKRDALASGSTVRTQPQPSRWSNIVDAMAAAGHPGMEAEKLRKKWNNLCGAFRKVSEYEKIPGHKSFWLLTPAEKREKEVDVSIARAAYDAIAEFTSDRRSAALLPNHTDVLRLRDTPHPKPQTTAANLPNLVRDPPTEGGDGVGEVEGVGTGHTQGEATEGSTPGSVAGNGEQAAHPNLRKRKSRPAASSLNKLTSAFIATMKDLTVLMDKQGEAKRVCMREQREGMMQHWTEQTAAIENQTNTIMNAILSTGRELAASIASVAAAIGSLQNRPPASTPPTTRSTFDSPVEFDAVYNARPSGEAWTGPGGAFETPMGTEWQASQSPPQ